MSNRADPGRLLVCFDFEGAYGMPYDVTVSLPVLLGARDHFNASLFRRPYQTG